MAGSGSIRGLVADLDGIEAEAACRRSRLRFTALAGLLLVSAALLAFLAGTAPTAPPARSEPSPVDRGGPMASPPSADPAPPAPHRTAPSKDPDAAQSLILHRETLPTVTEEMLAASTVDPASVGRELFARRWTPNDPRSHRGDGLGPVYNADSCLACHYLGGPGGAGPAGANVNLIVAVRESSPPPRPARRRSGFQPAMFSGPMNVRMESALIVPELRSASSVVVHHFGVDPSYAPARSKLLGLADPPAGNGRDVPVAMEELAQRNTPPLFGAGLIDAVPEAALIEAVMKPRNPHIRGRIRHLKGGRSGRFGWKAQAASLEEFVRGACANELGLEVPGQHQARSALGPAVEPPGLDLSIVELSALVAYIGQLPAPIDPSRSGSGGSQAFESIGCADCHVPDLGDARGIYSDLLLHDMGTNLASSGSSYGGSSSGSESEPGESEWRTPPLWGVAASAPYLHDGRAATIEEAIAAHGGQGSPSARAFFLLPRARRVQLLAFLDSMLPPPADRLVPPGPPDPGASLAAHPSVDRWRHRIEEKAHEAKQRREQTARNVAAAQFQMARNYEKIGRLAPALRYYRSVAREHPDSDQARLSIERIEALESR